MSVQVVFGAGTSGTENRHIQQVEGKNNQTAIPYRLGRITNGQYAGGERLVVYVQDLHCNPEVQNNIANILESLDSSARIRKIFLEGAPEGKLDASLFNTVSDKKLREGAIDRLLNKGILSGAEYYALKFKQNKLYGMENWDVYTANLDRYRKLSTVRAENGKISRDIELKITRLKWRYLDTKIKRIEKTFNIEKNESRHARIEKLGARVGEPIGGYPNLSRYVDLLKLNRTMRRKNVKEEMALYTRELRKVVPMSAYRTLLDMQQDGRGTDEYYQQLGEMGRAFAPALTAQYPGAAAFFSSLRLQYQINPLYLLEEQNVFHDRVMVKFAKRALDRDIIFLSRMAEDLVNYAGLKMTPSRYRYFEENKERFKGLLQKYFEYEDVRDALALLGNDEYAKFYTVNIKRNDFFIQSVLKSAEAAAPASVKDDSAGVPRAAGFESVLSHLSQFRDIDVVIAGGFHQDVVRILKDRGVSCLMITPNITRQYDHSIYQQVMTGTIDLRQVASSALAPVILLLGKDKGRTEAEVAALFADVHTLSAAQALINDLKTDPKFKLEATVDDAGQELGITINGRLAFSLAIVGNTTVKLVVNDVEVAEHSFDVADDTAADELKELVTAAILGAKDSTRALIDFIKKIFQNFSLAPMVFKETIVFSDMDETIAPLRAPITEASRDALIKYLKAGGKILIITGGAFTSAKDGQGAKERVIDQIMAALAPEDWHLLRGLHVMSNSGAEQWEYSEGKKVFECQYQSDMQDDLGHMDSRGNRVKIDDQTARDLGRKRVSTIRAILIELMSGRWVDKVLGADEEGQMLRESYLATFDKEFEAPAESLFRVPEKVTEDLRTELSGDEDNWQEVVAGWQNVTNKSDRKKEPLSNNVDMRRGEDDGLSQITFNPAGVDVNKIGGEVKAGFDPKKEKRNILAWYMNERFKQEAIPVEGKAAGATSIDIKPIGRDKGYGVRLFVKRYFNLSMTDEQADEILQQIGFMGDSLGDTGNDIAAARLMKWVVRVLGSKTDVADISAGVKHKTVDTAERGVEGLIPFLDVLSVVARINHAINAGGDFSDIIRELDTLPAVLRKKIMQSVVPSAQNFAQTVTHFSAWGTVQVTPFQDKMYRDPVLSAVLPGKFVVRVVPVVNPPASAVRGALRDYNSVAKKEIGIPGVAVALRDELPGDQASKEKSTTMAGRILVPYENKVVCLKVVKHNTAEGVFITLDVPARYTEGLDSAQAKAFLEQLYPRALASLVDALTNGDIVAATTGIFPWLIETNGLAVGGALDAFPVAVKENNGLSYEDLAQQYREMIMAPGQITRNNTGAGVMRQGALMIRVGIDKVTNPVGRSNDLATNAKNFVAQFEGLSDVQFDGLLSVDENGAVAEMDQVAAAVKEIEGGRIVLSLEVPGAPVDATAREKAAAQIAAGLVKQLKNHKGLGIRLMFKEHPGDEALRAYISTVARQLIKAGIAPETTLLVDTKDKAQADAVRTVSAQTGMSGLKAIQSVKTAGAASGDAVEVKIQLRDSDIAMPREQLTAIMSSPNAQLVVLHLDGETPAMAEQGVLVNLGMIRAAVTEFISFRQPPDPLWWSARGAQAARTTFADIVRLDKGRAGPAALAALAEGLMRVSSDGSNVDAVINDDSLDINKEMRELLRNKLKSLHKLIDKGEDDAVRGIRSAMIVGFVESLLGEVLYHQMTGNNQLSEEALQTSGESDRLKKFLTTFARSAGDDADMPVLLMKMQAGIVPVPSDEAEIAELKQRVRSYISAHSDDHATVYSVLKCADALGLGLSTVSERFDVSEKVPVGAQPGSAEALLVEFLMDARTLNLESLRNKVTAFLNQPDHDAAAQAMALGLYVVLLKAEFSKSVLEQGADAALPAVREVSRILSAA